MDSDPFALFELWIKEGHNQPLAPRSVGSYRSMWSSWVKFLTPQGLKWDTADQSVVLQFLTTLKPSAYSDAKSSTVSKVRYANILNRVYQLAKAADLIDENPVPVNHPSLPESESADSVFFRGEEYVALVDHLPVALTWQDARNRAVLACLLLDGLSGSEVSGLGVDDVKLEGEEDPRGRTRLVRLNVKATDRRPAQGRTVQLAWTTARAVSEWLKVREDHADRAAPLFPSNRTSGKLTNRAIFHICVTHVGASLATLGRPDIRWTHAGPNSLRNSCLLRWLEAGWPLDVIAKRAGLSRGRQLSRLLQSSLYL